eukprot:scaffold5198_cov188-Prasinococcus_capsulatus_cf.AAC.2
MGLPHQARFLEELPARSGRSRRERASDPVWQNQYVHCTRLVCLCDIVLLTPLDPDVTSPCRLFVHNGCVCCVPETSLYALNYRHPLSALSAFMIALANMDPKFVNAV